MYNLWIMSDSGEWTCRSFAELATAIAGWKNSDGESYVEQGGRILT